MAGKSKAPKKDQQNNSPLPETPVDAERTGALKDIRKEQIKKFHMAIAGICVRNGIDTGGVHPFVCRVTAKFGFTAMDEAVRVASEICTKGDPKGLIYTEAEKWFDTYGNDDEDYLDAMLTERALRGIGPPAAKDQKRFAIEDVIKPFTNRRISALSRLQYYETVRDFCRENFATYDYRLVRDYFECLIAEDPDLHRPIHEPSDIPIVDFEALRIKDGSK